VDLHLFDLNLLGALDALLTERNVTPRRQPAQSQSIGHERSTRQVLIEGGAAYRIAPG
jgi:hypothetical protein